MGNFHIPPFALLVAVPLRANSLCYSLPMEVACGDTVTFPRSLTAGKDGLERKNVGVASRCFTAK
jgi:hypothetical protein